MAAEPSCAREQRVREHLGGVRAAEQNPSFLERTTSKSPLLARLEPNMASRSGI